MPTGPAEPCADAELVKWAESFYTIQTRNIMSKFLTDNPERGKKIVTNLPEWSSLCEHDKKLLIATFRELFLELGNPND